MMSQNFQFLNKKEEDSFSKYKNFNFEEEQVEQHGFEEPEEQVEQHGFEEPRQRMNQEFQDYVQEEPRGYMPFEAKRRQYEEENDEEQPKKQKKMDFLPQGMKMQKEQKEVPKMKAAVKPEPKKVFEMMQQKLPQKELVEPTCKIYFMFEDEQLNEIYKICFPWNESNFSELKGFVIEQAEKRIEENKEFQIFQQDSDFSFRIAFMDEDKDWIMIEKESDFNEARTFWESNQQGIPKIRVKILRKAGNKPESFVAEEKEPEVIVEQRQGPLIPKLVFNPPQQQQPPKPDISSKPLFSMLPQQQQQQQQQQPQQPQFQAAPKKSFIPNVQQPFPTIPSSVFSKPQPQQQQQQSQQQQQQQPPEGYGGFPGFGKVSNQPGYGFPQPDQQSPAPQQSMGYSPYQQQQQQQPQPSPQGFPFPQNKYSMQQPAKPKLSSDQEGAVKDLISILGGSVSQEAVVEKLKLYNWNIEQAANDFLNQPQ